MQWLIFSVGRARGSSCLERDRGCLLALVAFTCVPKYRSPKTPPAADGGAGSASSTWESPRTTRRGQGGRGSGGAGGRPYLPQTS